MVKPLTGLNMTSPDDWRAGTLLIRTGTLLLRTGTLLLWAGAECFKGGLTASERANPAVYPQI